MRCTKHDNPSFLAIAAVLFFVMCAFAATGAAADQVDQQEPEFFSRDLSPEELNKLATQIYNYGSKEPSSWQDVKSNDLTRQRNLNKYLPPDGNRMYFKMLLYAIPRPQNENDILVREIREHLPATDPEKRAYLRELLAWFAFGNFCTNDDRLYELAAQLIEEERFPANNENYVAGRATAFMGNIHVEKSAAFLSAARWPEYWREKPFIKNYDGMARKQGVFSSLALTIKALERLPIDTGIRLMEEMYERYQTDPAIDRGLFRILAESLNELWCRKKGENVHCEEGLPSMEGGYFLAVSQYPEWLYGPGGKRVYRPFGEDPARVNDSDITRAKRAAYRAMAEQQEQQKIDEWYERAEVERKKCAPQTSSIP